MGRGLGLGMGGSLGGTYGEETYADGGEDEEGVGAPFEGDWFFLLGAHYII